VNVESATSEPASSKLWHQFRIGRITASKMKAVCATSCENPSLNLLRSICYPTEAKFLQRQPDCRRLQEKIIRDILSINMRMLRWKTVSFSCRRNILTCVHPQMALFHATVVDRDVWRSSIHTYLCNSSSSWTISFSVFCHSFLHNICWSQWEDSFHYSDLSICIDNIMFYYCIISIVFQHISIATNLYHYIKLKRVCSLCANRLMVSR